MIFASSLCLRINGLDVEDLKALLKGSSEKAVNNTEHYAEPCSSWHVAPGFILVSERRQSLSPAVLKQINRLLSQ